MCQNAVRSPLCVMYLDHVSVGGSAEDVLHDLNIIKAAEELGLFLNNNKSEIICNNALSEGNHHHCSPGCYGSRPREDLFAQITSGGCRSIDTYLDEKTQALSTMGSCFSHLSVHDSLILLCHSFVIPSSGTFYDPCFLSDRSITNTPLTQMTWHEVGWSRCMLGYSSGLFKWPPRPIWHPQLQQLTLVSALLPTSHQFFPHPHSDMFP